MIITDLNNPKLDVYHKLNEKQLRHFYEPKGGIFIAESYKVIDRALRSGYELESILMEEEKAKTKEGQDLINRAGDRDIYLASYDSLVNITGYNLTGGMLAVFKRKELPDMDSVLSKAKNIAVLENVVNPTNIGAIFRSVAAFNVDGVLLTKGCADPLERRAIRVSMGNVFALPWTYMTGDQPCISHRAFETFKKMDFATMAMALRGDSYPVDSPVLKEEDKKAIIMGTEGEGLRDSTIEESDYTVLIPMHHEVDSLNVAAASAVAIWELTKM
ncbi:MAG: RNA methyltransferase [Pseudobutyrivibrio sp.]|nr:RNA methyltransferase [Pseudobutyrivibrio sp.]